MARFICKFEDDKAYYLDWSTIVDAPVTNGMSLEEFTQYYKEEYGMPDLEERMERVKEKGTSSMIDDSLDSLVKGNHAGKHGTELSKEQILEFYCRQPTEDVPVGKSYNFEKDEYEDPNPRLISELEESWEGRNLNRNHVDELKAKIAKQGLLRPISVRGNKVVDGMHRLLACKELGWTVIPTEELTPKESHEEN